MPNKNELRKQAEEFLKNHPEKLSETSLNNLKDLVHELNVFQIELEMQNDELKSKQEELINERTKFSDFFEYSPNGFIVLNKDLKCEEVNATLCNLLGYSKGDFLGKSFSKFIHPGSQDTYFLMLRETYRENGNRNFVIQAKCKSGDLLSLRLDCKYIKKENRLWINIIDKTHLKELEDKQKFQAKILSSIGDAVIATDSKGVITYWGASAEKLYKWKQAEVLGKNILDVTPTNTSREKAGKIMESLLLGKSWMGEFLVKDKTGREFPIAITDTPILDEGGNLTGIIGVSRDITHIKDYQKRITRISEELEAQNEEMLVQNEELTKSNEELTKTTRELSESESLFKSLFEQSSTGAAIVEPTGYFLRVNKKFCEILGYSENEMMELNFRDFTHPDDVIKDERFIRKVLLNEINHYELEKRYYHKNGDIVWISLYSSIIRDEKEKVLYVIAIVVDITLRKVAELRLEEALKQEQFLADIIRNSSQGIGVGYRDGRLRILNKSGYDLIGYKQDELLDADWNKKLTPPEFWKMEKQKLQEMIRNKKPNRYEKEFIHKNGKRIPVELRVNPQFNKDGTLKYFFAFVNDISDRKSYENELFEEKERAQGYLDIAGVMFIVLDKNQNVILVNKKGCEVLEYEESEIIGRNWFDYFLPKEKKKDVKEVFNKVVAGNVKPVEYYENEVLTKSGKKKIIAWHNSIYRNNKGEISGLISSGEDITERVLIQEALKESEEKYRRLFEETSDPILLIEEEKFVDCNNITPGFLDYKSKDDICGKSPWEVSPEKQPDGKSSKTKAKSIINETLKEGHKRFEWLHMKRNGELVWVDVSLTFIPEKGKQRLYTIWRDVTQTKNDAEELKKHREHLEDLVKERTNELEDKNKKLEEFNNLFVGREFRIKELRDVVQDLKTRLKKYEDVD